MTIDRFTPRSTQGYNVRETQRGGCPCEITHLYQTTWQTEDRTPIKHQFTPMTLVNFEPNGRVLSSLKLDTIHGQLEMESLPLYNTGSSNVVLAKVSFECLVQKIEGTIRQFFTFDLKIPCISPELDKALTYSWVERAYARWDGISGLYQTLHFFYTLGRNIANPNDVQHGHFLDYNPNAISFDRYIRHSEQMLAAYLALPEASEMLAKRLEVTIRAKHASAVGLKVLNMALHLHSTKRCCAACEYVLLGLMNDRTPGLGIINNLKVALKKQPSSLQGRIAAAFKVIVTVTANEADADHRAQPGINLMRLGPGQPVPEYSIRLNDPDVSHFIYTTLLYHNYEVRVVPRSPQLNHTSVILSGSLKTATNKTTLTRVGQIRKKNIEDPDTLTNRLFHLSLS